MKSKARSGPRHITVDSLESRTLFSATHLSIVPTFDSTITKDANHAAIEAAINAGIAQIESDIATPITVRIKFEEGSAFGESVTYYESFSYSTYRKALAAHATDGSDASALASLPATTKNPVNGSTQVSLTVPNARALGLTGESSNIDGTVIFSASDKNLTRTSISSSKYDLQGVVMHEMDEVLGTGSALRSSDNGKPAPTGAIHAEDLYRYAANGSRSFNNTVGTGAYYSIDGGKTDLARFNTTSGGDRGDLYPGADPGGIHQVQDAFDGPGVIPVYNLEVTRLDVLGYRSSYNIGTSMILGAVTSTSGKNLSGFTVEAIQNGKVVESTVSNADGYQLLALADGTYTISVVHMTGYTQTSPAKSFTITLSGNEDIVKGKTFVEKT